MRSGRLAGGKIQAANAKAGVRLCGGNCAGAERGHLISVALWYLQLSSTISQLEMQIPMFKQS